MEPKDIIDAIFNGIECTALLVGGFWAYRKFIRTREDHPRISMDLTLDFVLQQDQQWLIEVGVVLENLGQVRHAISAKSFVLKLRYLLPEDQLVSGGEVLNHQVSIPHKAVVAPAPNQDESSTTRHLVSPGWEITFVDPGIKQRYSYLAAIPSHATAVLVQTAFDYADKESDFHNAQRIFPVPKP